MQRWLHVQLGAVAVRGMRVGIVHDPHHHCERGRLDCARNYGATMAGREHEGASEVAFVLLIETH